MSYQVLARKWRPRTFQTMVGQEHVLRMLTNALDQKRLHHAYLLTGTRGVGKTTLGRILAKCFNCEEDIKSTPCGTCRHCTAIDAGRFLDLIEVDAASRTKVEDTRELLENVQYPPAQGRFKIYLIDEVHMLSGHSFNALLKTLEEPPPYVKFILATTDPKRLPITILSRCLQFNLKRVPIEAISAHLQHICAAETVPFEEPALQLLADAADGSMRDALSLLDQAIAYGGDKITTADTRSMLGSIEQDVLLRLLQALADRDGKAILTEVAHLTALAVDFNQALQDLLSILHKINIAQLITDTKLADTLVTLATRFTPDEIQLFYQMALLGRRDLPFAKTPEQGFEMTLLRMLAFRPITDKSDEKQTKITTPEKPTPSAPPTKHDGSLNWTDTLAQLGLSGMAQALAANCTLTRFADDKLTLSLSAQHQPLYNKKLHERLEHTLTTYFKRPIKLEVTIVEKTGITPAIEQQQEHSARKANAKETIKNDSHVKQIINVFNATLDESSIKAV